MLVFYWGFCAVSVSHLIFLPDNKFFIKHSDQMHHAFILFLCTGFNFLLNSQMRLKILSSHYSRPDLRYLGKQKNWLSDFHPVVVIVRTLSSIQLNAIYKTKCFLIFKDFGGKGINQNSTVVGCADCIPIRSIAGL